MNPEIQPTSPLDLAGVAVVGFFLTALKYIYLIKETFFMNLMKTSKNKNHLILKKCQRTVETVFNSFLFLFC